MIVFERYQHINDLIQYYIKDLGRLDMEPILKKGISCEEDAITFSEFIWEMVEKINDDESNGIHVLGSDDNTEMFPDLSYEVTKYMRLVGYYSIWEKISDQNM